MSIFNFKLNKDCILKKPVELPESLGDSLPKDYADFLMNYDGLTSEDEDLIYIKLDQNISVHVFNLNEVSCYIRDKDYPSEYIPIAKDYYSPSFSMSLQKEDFGSIYFIDLETWQDYVMDEPNDVQISNMKKHAIKVAASFTEFAQKLYAKD